MQYLGGKYRIARHIERLVLAVKGDRETYIEPFLGGAATFSRIAPHFDLAFGYDIVPDLVMMWQAAINGWMPPTELDEETWRSLKTSEPSALRGFAGFGCSFGGRWFEGYARRSPAAGRPTDETSTAPGSSRSVVRQAARMQRATVRVLDYRDLHVPPGAVIYADPPYVGTKGYSGTPKFSTEQFWRFARSWVQSGAVVLVSERSAPEDFKSVWSASMGAYLKVDEQKAAARTEHVFMHTSQSGMLE